MRFLAVRCETIRIISVAGELRHINVAGLAKARLLWLFRSFSVLDFHLLYEKQQQFITEVWHAAPRAGSADTPLNLIGTIEGFSPQLYPLSLLPLTAKKTPLRGALFRARGLRIPVIWAAPGVLLLVYAIGLVLSLGLTSRVTPRPRATTAAVANRVSPTGTPLAPALAEPASSFANLRASATRASGSQPLHLPNAIARDASSPDVKSPYSATAASTKEEGRPEVIIRVSVDRAGRATAFHILQGEQKEIAAALDVAQRWSFQPCTNSDNCEHSLRFKTYGDASIMQMID